jgi:hypothetical protein
MEKVIKSIKKIDNVFIIIGIVEVFLWVLVSSGFFAALIGILTIYPAYMAQKNQNYKWNYFLGVLSIVKFNPLTLAILSFLLGDLAYRFNSAGFYICTILSALVFLASLILGIILLVKTAKFYRLKRT